MADIAARLVEEARSVKEAAEPLAEVEEQAADWSLEHQQQQTKVRNERQKWAVEQTPVGPADAIGFVAACHSVVVGRKAYHCHRHRRQTEYSSSTID